MKFDKFLKLKTFKYLVFNDISLFVRFFLKRPFFYFFNFFLPYKLKKEKNTYLFGIKSLNHFDSLIKNKKNILILGFSYCHKPHECPSFRFSEHCKPNVNTGICQKCTIHTYKNIKNTYFFTIPTINHLGKKILEIMKKKDVSSSQILFILTACDLSIHMFANAAKILKLKGIALPLEGNVCSTFKCFALAEKGIKPPQTIFSSENQLFLKNLLHLRNLS